MRLVSTMKKAVRDRLLARAGGLDLTRLDKVPDTLSWPLQREVMAPEPAARGRSVTGSRCTS